jgi:hypothetical protein
VPRCGQRRIVIEIDGATDKVYARLAHDVWARLSDPPRGESIEVLADDDANQLNGDFDRRYRAADPCEDHGQGTPRRRSSSG